MSEFIGMLLGDYARQFITQMASFPMMLFCTLLFSLSMKRHEQFFLRILLGVAITVACYVGIAVLRTDFEGIGSRLITNVFAYFITLPILFVCFQEAPVNILLAWCAGIATQEVGARAFSLLLACLGINDRESMSFFADYNELRDWTIFYFIHFSIYFGCFLIARRPKCLDADRSSVRRITFLSVFSALWLAVSSTVTREFQLESFALYNMIQYSALLFATFILALRTGILSENQYRREIALMEQVLYEERKQYQSVKENIDIINMKCHDLKHQLSNLSGKLTEQEVASLQEAIKIYDGNIKTGSEVLDVLLYEKQLVCEKDGIRLSCMADGKALSFMRTTHIYSLFNNALGNALEAVRSVTNPDMRVVDISVAQNGGMIEIEVSNYFEGERSIQDGLPLATTKDDKNHHGFGIMSMKYVAEQYGGTLQTTVLGPIFTLKIQIPMPHQ